MSEQQSFCHPGAYIKENVIPKGLSITKAAKMMGIGRPALSNFLNGKANLSKKMAVRLEKTFGVKKEFLYDLQQKHDSFVNREEEKRIAVKSYVPSFLKITSTHIDAWADKIQTRSLLPVLLRRLVNTTGDKIIASNFPAYDKSQTPGWDGRVESGNATPWIPAGLSCWEFGCDKKPKTKADGDFKSRIKSIPITERQNISFVFVTPRNWPKKEVWLEDVRSKNEWLDVFAFDAGDIEQWLETSVSSQVWLAEELGLPTIGCQSLISYWLEWSQTTQPALSPQLFNSAISDYKEKIIKWYEAKSSKPFILTAGSKDEAKAFFSCITNQIKELQPLYDQAIFASTPEIVKKLSDVSRDIIPIVYTDSAQKELIASFDGRPSIIITERNIKGIEPDICIDLPNFDSFKVALQDMGFDEAQIDVYSNRSGNSPTILRRLLARVPALQKTNWATSSAIIKKMIPLVLAGAWNSNKDADKEILSCLANEDYSKIEKDIAELASIDDSPIWTEGRFRGVVSKLECFIAVSDQLTSEDIDNFFDIAEYILSEDDPALDLEKKDRWAANIYNKVRDHSSAIRTSICQNLIILAVHGNGFFGQRFDFDMQSRVSFLIERLLSNKEPRAWQAQQSDLPLYAEAAPEMYLSIVEEELGKDTPSFKVLFEPVDSGLFGRCERTGMLWALELLAWNPIFLSRVVTILGKLSTYDIDDNWSNKPINSLKDILLVWKPHTAATVEQRCAVLELLCSKYPNIGWEMCIIPLKSGSVFTSGTYRPNWRAYASGVSKEITYGEAREYTLKCLNLVLSWSDHSLEMLKDLVRCLPSMEDDDKKAVLKQIEKWVLSSPGDENLTKLREHVRTTTMTSRALISGKKDTITDYVNGKELYELLEPKDLLFKHLWLFANTWVEYTPEELGETELDHEDREKRLAKKRVLALKEILTERGLHGLLSLIDISNSSYQIGLHLFSDILSEEHIFEFIVSCLNENDGNLFKFDSCISGILVQMNEKDRNVLISDIIDKVSSEHDKVLRLFLCSPFQKSTWGQIEEQSIEIKTAYWHNVHPGWVGLSLENLNYAIDRLLEFERPLAAFNLARLKLKHLGSNSILKLLFSIATDSPEPDSDYKPSKHDIEEALKTLNQRNDFDRTKLVNLEYIYVDILYSHSNYGIPNLSKEISKSPLFFIQLVAFCFKRRGKGEDPAEWNIPKDREKKEAAATRAYHILQCIDVLPGTGKDGSINVDELSRWISDVRKLAQENGRKDITDQMIGKLLSTCSMGKDGVWPREEIRSVFEEVGSFEISIGMEIGLYNSDGAQFREVDSSNERARAEKYREMAGKVINQHPFVGRMLNRIAKHYDRDAERWETEHRIEKRLRGW